MHATAIALVVVILTISSSAIADDFLRGDANGDGDVSIADVQFLYTWFFREGPAASCEDAADSNDDGAYTPRDGIWVFRHVVLGDRPPPAPYPEVGADESPDGFDCTSYGGGAAADDPRAVISIATAVGSVSSDTTGDGPRGWARIEIAVSSSVALGAYSGRVVDGAGVLAASSNDHLIPGRPSDEPDLAVVERSIRSISGRDRPIGLASARVFDGELRFGAVPAIKGRESIPPGDHTVVMTITLPLARGTTPGDYALELMGAELATIDGRAIAPTRTNGTLRVRAAPAFLRGDCNGDGGAAAEVSDAVAILAYNFLGGPAPACLAACDVDGDGVVAGQTTDAAFLLRFAFLGGSAPPFPFPDCDFEHPESALGCDVGVCASAN